MGYTLEEILYAWGAFVIGVQFVLFCVGAILVPSALLHRIVQGRDLNVEASIPRECLLGVRLGKGKMLNRVQFLGCADEDLRTDPPDTLNQMLMFKAETGELSGISGRTINVIEELEVAAKHGQDWILR